MTPQPPAIVKVGSPELAAGAAVALITIIVGLQSLRFGTIDSQYADIGKRLTDLSASVDRRVDGLQGRIDTIIDRQAKQDVLLATMQSDIGYMRVQLNKVADKLNVASLEPTNIPTVQTPPVIPTATFAALTETQLKWLYDAIKDQPHRPLRSKR